MVTKKKSATKKVVHKPKATVPVIKRKMAAPAQKTVTKPKTAVLSLALKGEKRIQTPVSWKRGMLKKRELKK